MYIIGDCKRSIVGITRVIVDLMKSILFQGKHIVHEMNASQVCSLPWTTAESSTPNWYAIQLFAVPGSML